MKIALRTIEALSRIITGDGNISPYRSGPNLVSFFNNHGANNFYGRGFPSRWLFAEQQLRNFNGTATIKSIIEDSIDPRHYLNTDFNVATVVEHLNQYLAYDGFQIVKEGLYYRVRLKQDSAIPIPAFVNSLSSQKGSHTFILEQSDKCREKLESGDYDGAITNARSMVEAVFQEILLQSGQSVPNHDGDLNKIYREVKKALNLDSGQQDLADTLKQILSGLNSIVTGIAGISNKSRSRNGDYSPPPPRIRTSAPNASGSCLR